MFVRTNSCLSAFALTATLLSISSAAQATAYIEGVRFGRHEGYVRLVVDSQTPLLFDYKEGAYPFVVTLKDAKGPSMDVTFAKSYAPLHHLVMEALENGSTALTVTATENLSPRFLQLDKDDRGLYRLVIDLSGTENLEHLSIGQEGLNSQRVRVQFGDSLTAGR